MLYTKKNESLTARALGGRERKCPFREDDFPKNTEKGRGDRGEERCRPWPVNNEKREGGTALISFSKKVDSPREEGEPSRGYKEGG